MHEAFPTSPSATDPEALLVHAAWVRRLARALVRGGDPAADSDDVEQQTWLAALRSSREPAAGGTTSPRGWLRAVARNVARRLARDHAARQRREESSARDEALAPADDAVVRAELHGKVVAAVLALGEPYRSTLIRRFLDEKSPTQIAALDQVPVDTVKTRLKRGLALLRDRFAQELGEPRGGERDWRQALLALFPPGAAGGAALVGSGTVTALSMKWKLLAAAFLALVTFGALVWREPERDGGGASLAAAAAAAASAPMPGRMAASPAPAAARELLEERFAAAPALPPADARAASRAVPRLHIAGIVRDPGGAPVADAWVWFSDARAAWTRDPTAWFGAMASWTRSAEPAGFQELPRTRTDRAGRFEFVSAERASWRVAAWHADAGAALSGERPSDRSRPAEPTDWLDLTLRPLVGLRGRCVDERGAPLPQATLQLTVDDGNGPVDLECLFPWRRRDDATFELPPMPALAFRGSASALGYAGTSFEIDATSPLPIHGIHQVELVLQREPGRVRVGRIVVANGTGSLAADLLPDRRGWELDGAAGQPFARVACSIVRFESEPPDVGSRLARDGIRAGEVHLADGTYVVDPSSFPSSEKIGHVGHVGLVVREVVVAVAELRPEEPAPDLRVDAALVPREPATGVLRVRLRGARELARERAGESLWVVPFGGTVGGGLWMPIDATSSPDELRVAHVPTGRVAVHYTLPGVVRVAGEADVVAGRTLTLDLALRSGTRSVCGFVEGRSGGPLRHAGSVRLYARREGRTVLPALAVAEAVGERFFSFDSLPAGEYALSWQRPRGPAVAIVAASEDPEPVILGTADGIDVTIAAHFENGERPAAMSLRILRMDGTPEYDEIGTIAWKLDAGGERAVSVSAGRHRVQLFAEGAAAAEAELDTRVATFLDVPLRRR